MFQTYQEAHDWITKVTAKRGIKPGLKRMEALMERLDHPQRRLKFIHVAGTNGKGSTCAYLAAAIRGAGFDVGLFTSPYLGKYTNRIQYNGESIPEESVVRFANQIRSAAEEIEAEYGELSMFEISTAIALLYFAREAFPHYVVWETGMGGRLDSTNVVFPVVSVITNVAMDHTDVLGDTIVDIAREKAGIIKNGVPVISGVLDEEAAEVIRQTAEKRKSTLYQLGKQFRYEAREVQEGRQVIDFTGPFRELPEITITMNGTHQQMNAALALMTIEVLRQYYALVIEDEDLYQAFEQAKWIGRLEMISDKPRLLVDGAHNPDSARALSEALQTLYRRKKLIIVLAMMSNKNHREYLRHILPIVDTIIVTELDFFKKTPADQLADEVRAWQAENGGMLELAVEPDWKQAVKRAISAAGEDDLIVVTGSLYFVSDVRSLILNQTDSEKGW